MKKVIKSSIFLIFIMLASLKLNALWELEKIVDLPVLSSQEKNICLGLNYHRVNKPTLFNKLIDRVFYSHELSTYNVYADDFANQMDALIDSGTYFATQTELMAFQESGEFPDKCVWVSFDDGDISVYNDAFPILKKRGIPFTVFIISGQVGNANFNNFEMMSWHHLRELRDSGIVTFGSHTHDMHQLVDESAIFLAENRYEQFAKDIKVSKQILEKELETEIIGIAYPFGETSDEITQIVEEVGFKQAYILCPVPIDRDNFSYYLNRYLVDRVVFDEVILPYIQAQ